MPSKKLLTEKDKFKQLQTKWYKKLKDTGFDDIERKNGNLKRPPTDFWRGHSEDTIEIKTEYYRLAEQFTHQYPFDNEFEATIWAYHSNGLSMRNIAKTLEKVLKRKTNRTTVNQIVKKLKVKMYQMYLEPKNEYHE